MAIRDTVRKKASAGWIGSTVFLVVAIVLNPWNGFAQAALNITTGTFALPPVIIGVPYSQALTASGGSPPYTWSLGEYRLPPGLTLTTSGLLTGTYNGGSLTILSFSATVTDSAGTKATKPFYSAAYPQLKIVTDSQLPRGKAGYPYFAQLAYSGGEGDVLYGRWSFTSGSLPLNLTLLANGSLTDATRNVNPPPGVQASGTFHFTATVADQWQRVSKDFVLIFEPIILQFTTDPILREASSALDEFGRVPLYRQRITVSGTPTVGSAGYSGLYRLEIVAGALPPGVVLDLYAYIEGQPWYELTGRPQAPGRFTFTIKATEPYAAETTRDFTLVVQPDPTLKILSQFAFGGGWYSALYFTNTNATTASIRVDFVTDSGTPLNVPAVGGSSVAVNLGPRGTAIIEAPDTGSLNQGYVSVSLPRGVVGHGVFRQSTPGIQDQEAVVPLSGVYATTNTLIFDDTNLMTAVAIVNPSSVATTVSIIARDGSGNSVATSNVLLAAKSKTAVFLRDLPGMASIAGRRGSADFTVTTGSVAVLGLRFDGVAFTSIPTTEK